MTEVLVFNGKMEEKELLRYAAAVESNSEHPIAKGIVESAEKIPSVTDFNSIPGKGARGKVEGKEVGVVSPGFSRENRIPLEDDRIEKLTRGLAVLCEKRQVNLIRGRARFEDSTSVRLLDSEADVSHIQFKHAIVATGSYPVPLPGTEFKEGGRIMSSTGALDLADVPERLLVVGGGYVGVELGAVYASLGSKVTLVEMAGRLMPHADKELVDILTKELTGMFDSIHYNTGVKKMEETEKEVKVVFEGDVGKKEGKFDRALVAVGRKPASGDLGLENTEVELDGKGYIKVDDKLRTADGKIFAVGDVVGGAMLAHKAMYEGKIAAEVIAKKPAAFDARAIPAVVYTFPQLAWCGLMEKEAREQGIEIKVGRFPWSASGRAASMGSSTHILSQKQRG